MYRLVKAGMILAILVLTLAGGCGGSNDEITVSGQVTIDGAPIPTGVISFVDTDPSVAAGGGPIKDGQYTATVTPGDKVVTVLGNKLVGQEPEYEDVPDSPMRDKYEMITPPDYNAAHLSPLKATITGPQDDLDFDLDSSL